MRRIEFKDGLKKGRWAIEEDRKLINFIYNNQQCLWRDVPKLAGLSRCGKSCRLRWLNYLRPDLKREILCPNEEKLIIDLYAQFGSKWAKIASCLPGRTDNEIKNQWHTRIKKKLIKMDNHHLVNPSPPSTNTQEHGVDPKERQTSTFINEIMIDQLFMDKQSTRPNDNFNEEHEILESVDIGSRINEALLIERHEILIPSAPSTSSSTNITTKIDTTTYDSSKLGEKLRLHDFEWPCNEHSNNVSLWDDEFSERSYLCRATYLRSPCSDVFSDFNGDDSKLVLDLDTWIYKYGFF